MKKSSLLDKSSTSEVTDMEHDTDPDDGPCNELSCISGLLIHRALEGRAFISFSNEGREDFASFSYQVR